MGILGFSPLLFWFPLIEIGVFIEVGGLIGLWPTLGLIILTAVLGTWQLRAQGLATLARARDQMEKGAMPARELFDGVCLLIAGGLLLTPGFVTDSLGGLLFVPPFRDLLRRWIGKRLAEGAEVRFHSTGGHPGGGRPGGTGGGDGVIDGDFRDVTDPDGPPPDRPQTDRTPPENKKLPR